MEEPAGGGAVRLCIDSRESTAFTAPRAADSDLHRTCKKDPERASQEPVHDMLYASSAVASAAEEKAEHVGEVASIKEKEGQEQVDVEKTEHGGDGAGLEREKERDEPDATGDMEEFASDDCRQHDRQVGRLTEAGRVAWPNSDTENEDEMNDMKYVRGESGLEIAGPDGLPLRREVPVADKVLRDWRSASVIDMVPGLALTRVKDTMGAHARMCAVATGSASVWAAAAQRKEHGAIQDYEFDMMERLITAIPDTGCEATVLHPAAGRMHASTGSRTIWYTGFNGEREVGRGGNDLDIAIEDEDGVWRKRNSGPAYTVQSATNVLWSIPVAQKYGLGAVYPPGGGAMLRDDMGYSYPMRRTVGGAYSLKMYILPEGNGIADGDVVNVEGLQDVSAVVREAHEYAAKSKSVRDRHRGDPSNEVGGFAKCRCKCFGSACENTHDIDSDVDDEEDQKAYWDQRKVTEEAHQDGSSADEGQASTGAVAEFDFGARHDQWIEEITKRFSEGECTDERVLFMRRQHALNHESAAVLSRMHREGKFGDRGCFVTPEMLNCECCPASKMHRKNRSRIHSRSHTKWVLHSFQVDIYDPRGETSTNRGGFKYVMQFVCLASGFRFVYYMKDKTAESCLAGLKALEQFVATVAPDVHAKHGYVPKVARLCMDVDPGMTTTWGYTRSVVDEYCLRDDKRIAREFTTRDVKHKNGKVERSWRTMDEQASAMLFDSGLSEEWYYDAVGVWTKHANYRSNGANRLGNGEAPALTLGLQDVDSVRRRLRPFGAPGWILKSKLKSKGRRRGGRCLFIGYGGDTCGYRVVDLLGRDVVSDLDVVVSETLASKMDLVQSIRTDPFYAAKYGEWVWKLLDKQPTVRPVGVPILDSSGMIWDEVEDDGFPKMAPKDDLSAADRGGMLDVFEESTAEVTETGGSNEVSQNEPGIARKSEGSSNSTRNDIVSKRKNQVGGSKQPYVLPNTPTTVGTSASGDSREALRPRKDENNGKKSKDRKGWAMSKSDASAAITEARTREGWGVRYVADDKPGVLSNERYQVYKKCTTFDEIDRARKTTMVFGNGKTDYVMRSGDLQYDVARGYCQIVDNSGEPVLAAPKIAMASRVRLGGERDMKIIEQARLWTSQMEDGRVQEMPFAIAMAAKMRAEVYVDGMREPVSIQDAMRLPEWKLWQAAIEKEVSKLVLTGVWEEVPLSDVPPGRKVVGSHFVFKIKTKDDGSGRLVLDKVKARLVFSGHLSQYGIDFHETAAYTCSPKVVRAMISLAARRAYRIVSWDISQAFTFSEIPEGEDVYMQLPQLLGENGVPADGDYKDCGRGKGSGYVARLNNYLYGQKDASRAWMISVQKFMKEIGAKQMVMDRMAFRWEYEGEEMNLCVHVDDIVATPSSEKIRVAFEDALKAYFGKERVTGGDETNYVLGMRIDRDWDKRTITLSQGAFVRKVLEDFGVVEGQGIVKTPLPPGLKLKPTDDDEEQGRSEGEKFNYLMLVGSLQWLVMSTRPDLGYAAGLLGRYSKNPGAQHIAAAKHVLKYLAGTADLGVTYHGSDEVLTSKGYDRRDKLIASVDSDLGGCVDTQVSTTGFVIWLNGGPIAWKSRKQSTVSTATMEAEMKAASLLGMDLVWYRDAMFELGVLQGCVRVMEDNSGCVASAHGQRDTAKSANFKRTQAYVEQLCAKGVMWLDDVPGIENPADIFTKSVEPSHQFKKLRDLVMGVSQDVYVSPAMHEMMIHGNSSRANALLNSVRAWQNEEQTVKCDRCAFENYDIGVGDL